MVNGGASAAVRWLIFKWEGFSWQLFHLITYAITCRAHARLALSLYYSSFLTPAVAKSWDLRICTIKMIYNGNFNQREQKKWYHAGAQPSLTLNVNLVFIRVLLS